MDFLNKTRHMCEFWIMVMLDGGRLILGVRDKMLLGLEFLGEVSA